MEETKNMTVTFTVEEIYVIKTISDSYSQMYKDAINLKEEIMISEKQLADLLQRMEEANRMEHDFYLEMAAKKDIQPQDIANAAANYVLSTKNK